MAEIIRDLFFRNMWKKMIAESMHTNIRSTIYWNLWVIVSRRVETSFYATVCNQLREEFV
jgi:hypothetical protein